MTAMKEGPCPNARKRRKGRRRTKIDVTVEEPSPQDVDDWVETEDGLKQLLTSIQAADSDGPKSD